ncbi:MAG TPA: cytochrome c oxidase subunit II [Candidatus Acidoferrales bacterium]|nr:cytochrome c oxidase subunit II [Candidatus Acidoferrales bacterium]
MKHEHPQHLLDAGFWRAVIVCGVISAALMYVVVIFPIDKFLPEASNVSVPIDRLFRFCWFFGVPILVYVNGMMIYFAIRYRHRPDEPIDAVGSPIHDNRALEAAWTIGPALLMVALAVFSYFIIPMYYPTGQAAASAVTMEAIGHKWYFEFRYPGLHQSVENVMHLPVGVPVTVDITSEEATDDVLTGAVLHSFWVPEFRLKQDMIPGMVVPIHFTPTEIGTFHIVCAEFCGEGHSHMWGSVVVQSKPDFDAWYQSQLHAASAPVVAVNLAAGDAAAGQALFNTKCTVCHNAAPFAQRKVGPGLAGIFTDPAHPNLVNGQKATPENVASILQHGAHGAIGVMPDMQANGISNTDIANLVAYLKTLH